ncbi:MAG: DUF350 domain-containing protein [Rhodospirillales bacterium]|nr:DUF350 domain-containing protein [Rhodospirillales bacterium]
MEAVIQSLISGAPYMLLHFSVTVAMLVVGLAIYIAITPYHEIKLIKSGNTSAAISFGAIVLGLGMTLAASMIGSVNVFDIIIYGFVAILIQLVTYRITDMLLRKLPERIENDEIPAAVTLGSLKLAVAFINSAAVAG